MSSVLTAFYETVDTMLRSRQFAVALRLRILMYTLRRGQIDRQTIMENLEIIMMAMDEIVDDGMIMEIDSTG